MRTSTRPMGLLGLALGAALVASACSSSTATPTPAAAATPTVAPSAAMSPTSLVLASTTNATLGEYLTGQNGMTLYFNNVDSGGASACTGDCATNWPPLTVAAGSTVTGPASATAAFGTITRPDGTTQVAYNGMPLYYFSGDSVAGDTTGNGKADGGGTWSVALVSGTMPGASGPAPSAAPSATASASSGY